MEVVLGRQIVSTMHFKELATLFAFLISVTVGMAPEQGIFTRDIMTGDLKNTYNSAMYEGFTKSMYNKSTVSLKVLSCTGTGSFHINWMIRYTECEGPYALVTNDSKSAMGSIFKEPMSRFAGEKTIFFYKSNQSQGIVYDCVDGKIDHSEPLPFETPVQWDQVEEIIPVTPVEDSKVASPDDKANKPANSQVPSKTKRDAENEGGAEPPPEKEGGAEQVPEKQQAGVNPPVEKQKLPTAAAPTTQSTTTHNVVQTIIDGRYLFIVELRLVEGTETKSNPLTSVTVEVAMRTPKGYISAFQWPLLPFYGVMCAVYSVLAFIWLLLLGCNWRDLLRIQFWIGGVLVLGLLEKAIFYAEFEHLNSNATSDGAIIFAELMSCLKRSLARMLLIVVSLGYGITRPRLGRDLHWVMAAGGLYFLLSATEGCLRVKGNEQHALIAILPLAVLDAVVCWWIFKNLVDTTRQLRLRRNLTKLWLYRHLTNTLIVCIISAVIFLIWSTKAHKWTTCVMKWRELWLDDAYWHVLFCIILVVIMFLVRPTANNQRYAFSPLVDAVDDEESQQPMISDAYDTVKMRQIPGEKSNSSKSAADDALKWVEDNIPAAVADAALGAFDDSEEELVNTLERNKME